MATHGIMGYGTSEVPAVVAESVFKDLDTNHDETLDQSELTALVEEKLGLESERAEAAMLLMDKDGSGGIDKEEFTAWLRSDSGMKVITDNSRYDILCKALELFKQYDADGSRTLSKEELGKLLEGMGLIGGDVSVDSAFDGLDSDNNGLVSFSEFLRWLNWLPVSPVSSPMPKKK